jgi:insertion element IS1 protein InsB
VFVGHKGNKQWIWLALDGDTREMIGFHVGDRSEQGARALWASLPGERDGQTSYIERFNCTMRQRVSRFVCQTLSFSQKLENHIGAIWLFVHHYNASLPV